MHETQNKILKLAQTRNVLNMSLSELKDLLGLDHSQKVKHHLEQLRKKGLLYSDKHNHKTHIADPKAFEIDEIFNLPIMGMANCGSACELAHENILSYLKISPKIVDRKSPEGLFAVKAVGKSLNQAQDIKGGPIRDGDYVIIDLNNKTPQNGDYVLSIIDDAANLKRFYEDKENQEIRLVSESSQNLPPIVIHKSDLNNSSYMINGTVLRVIRNK